MHSEGWTNYYLVRAAKGADLGQMKLVIDAVPGVQAAPKEEFISVNRRIIDTAFLPIIVVLVVIGAVVGVAVIALTLYTATIEKSREYGVLKAIGASNWRLYRIVLQQALAAGLLGYGAGIGLMFGALAVVREGAPTFISATRAVDLALVLGMAVAMAAVASYVPVQRLVRIDPAIAFKQ